MDKKLKAPLVHCQMSPYHSSDTIPYHTMVQTEKCHEPSHIYSRRRNPTHIMVSLLDWHYVWHHIGIKNQQLDIVKGNLLDWQKGL